MERFGLNQSCTHTLYLHPFPPNFGVVPISGLSHLAKRSPSGSTAVPSGSTARAGGSTAGLAVVPPQDFSTAFLAAVLHRTFCEDFLGGGWPGSVFALPWAQR